MRAWDRFQFGVLREEAPEGGGGAPVVADLPAAPIEDPLEGRIKRARRVLSRRLSDHESRLAALEVPPAPPAPEPAPELRPEPVPGSGHTPVSAVAAPALGDFFINFGGQ